MSQAVQELGVVLFMVALFAVATSVAARQGSEELAWFWLAVFLSFSLLAAWLLWRML